MTIRDSEDRPYFFEKLEKIRSKKQYSQLLGIYLSCNLPSQSMIN